MWICGCNCCGTHCLLIWCLLWITGTPVFLGKHHVCLCCIIKNIKKIKLKSLDKIWCKHSVIQLKTENLSHGICSQNTQKVKKQTLFNQTKQDRMQFFFFRKFSVSKPCAIQKQTNHLSFASFGRGLSCPLPFTRIQPAKDKWFVCFCIVYNFEK